MSAIIWPQKPRYPITLLWLRHAGERTYEAVSTLLLWLPRLARFTRYCDGHEIASLRPRAHDFYTTRCCSDLVLHLVFFNETDYVGDTRPAVSCNIVRAGSRYAGKNGCLSQRLSRTGNLCTRAIPAPGATILR